MKKGLREVCRRDRDFLIAELDRMYPGRTRSRKPSEVIDDIITEVLDFDLVEMALPRGQLAVCDFDERTVFLSTRMAEAVRPNTDLVALANSTKAHELGHIRLHEREFFEGADRISGTLFPELENTRRLVTYRDEERPRLSAAERRREREADFYAAIFLVPETLLEERSEVRNIRRALERQGTLSSSYLWRLTYNLARWFLVSPTLMKNHLVALGLLEYDPRQRELFLAGQQLLV